MRINNNMMAMNTHRQLGVANEGGAKSMEKLSSGMRINRAGDDAAGLAISEKMRGQIRGLNQASSNAQDGISLIQTAEGALNETHAILQRMRELTVQASSDTNVEADRGEIQKELTQLTEEIDRIANTTEFNTMKLVNGDRAAAGSSKKVVSEVKNVAAGDLVFATGVGGKSLALKDDKVTIDKTGAAFKDVVTGEDIKMSIEKTSAGIKVSIDPTGSTSTFVSVDDIVANEAGDYVYKAHGAEFTISGKDYAAMATGDKMDLTIDFTEIDTGGFKSVKNDFITNTGTAATVENFAVTKETGTGFENIGSVNAVWDAGKLTVTIKDDAGKTLSEDKIDVSAGDSYTYNAHGVSFDLGTDATTTKVEFTKELKSELVEKTVTNATDKSLKFQVGANENQKIELAIEDMGSAALKINTIAVDSHESAKAAITTVNNAIERVSGERSKLGAVQNRLEHTIKNLDTSSENLQASEARIRDVDMAKEMMEQTKQNILAQASTAMLANANQAPQAVLQLLR